MTRVSDLLKVTFFQDASLPQDDQLQRDLPSSSVEGVLDAEKDEGARDASTGVSDPPPPPAPVKSVVIPPGAWLDNGQLYMRDIRGHRYRVREDGTRETKTTRPLGWTSRAWFNSP